MYKGMNAKKSKLRLKMFCKCSIIEGITQKIHLSFNWKQSVVETAENLKLKE
jgi:hypothetical protein